MSLEPAHTRSFLTSGSPVRMVAIDLDGTLLRSDKSLTKRNARAVQAAVRQGVRVVLASARPPRSTIEIYHALGLSTYQINYNGALIFDPKRDAVVRHTPLDARIAQKVVRIARKMDPEVVVSIEVMDKWYTDRVDDTLPTESSKHRRPDRLGPLDDVLREPVTKLMLLAPPVRLRPVRDRVIRKMGKKIGIAVSDDYLLQVVHPSVDKAEALAWVAHEYGILAEEVMAIGDAPNDVGMMKWAGLGAAVASGWEDTLAAADVVVPGNDHDGVAEAIEQYVLK